MILLLWLGGAVAADPAGPLAAESPAALPHLAVVNQRETVRAAYAAELDNLAAQCQQQGLADAARYLRSWLPPEQPHELLVFLTPSLASSRADSAADPAADPPESVDEAAEWQVRFQQLRAAQGERLFALAREALQAGQAGLAWQLVVEAVRENPQLQPARRFLGYEQFDGRWLSRFEAAKQRARQVWHPRYGWLPADRLSRYEAGQRYHQGRWISAEQDAVLHRPIDRGWEVTTEHYAVRTNHSLEAGVRLAARLETLHEVWRQLFPGFHLSDVELVRMIDDGATRPPPVRRYDVVFYRDRDEYLATLKSIQPNIDITTGFFLGDARKAYFYATDASDDSNLFHEATHQLFSLSRPSVRSPGKTANFWVIEGVACYMESLVTGQDYCTLGGNEAIRLRNAQYRLLADGFYSPLAEFVALGRERFQADPQIARLYSQAAGLTHFLMHYDQGRYREALVDYLVAVYSGRDDADTLARLSGASYQDLDRQYREFLEATVRGQQEQSGDER